MRLSPRFLLFVLAAMSLGCELPRDPGGTLNRVRGGTLRVGVIHDPPWARVAADGKPTGVEVALVEALAAELGASIAWVPGGEGRLMHALERRELDLVIGGLTRETPWKSRVALSRPYYTTHFRVGSSSGDPPGDIDGVEVAVRTGDPLTAGIVKEEGGVSVATAEPAKAGKPVVAEGWRLERWGLQPGRTLAKREHVWAAPPGENGWLVHLDHFLAGRRDTVPALLSEEGGK